MKALKSPVALILISCGLVAAYLFWLKPLMDKKKSDTTAAERQKKLIDAAIAMKDITESTQAVSTKFSTSIS